jgi:hypothetical protein
MNFRIILIRNGEYKKTLYKSTVKTNIFQRYFLMIEENKEIKFPRKFINTKKIKPVDYQLAIIKPTEKTDKFRILRDNYGKVYTEKPLGDWTILASAPYNIEETFWIYGENPFAKTKKPTINGVVKKLFIGAHKKNMIKQVIVVHNKLLIYNEEYFDMVICKCIEDAQRLHHTLANAAKKQKIKSLLFMGTATPATASEMYKLIEKNTSWPLRKIWRKNTRP